MREREKMGDGYRALPDLVCGDCGSIMPPTAWRCDCGGPLDLAGPAAFQPEVLPEGPRTIWRYREALPPVAEENIVSLGEGWTPLVGARGRPGLVYKLDYLFPSGSFKDRGSSVLASCLRQLGVGHLIEDSSGNAGASMAAYFAAASIACTIYVPASASPAKTGQIRSHGAELVLVEGSRADVTRAAQATAQTSYYGSHQWSPYFLAGTSTFAFEVWEQLGRRVPENVVVPVGSGTLLLGVYLGFRSLAEAGVTDRLPRIFGAQAEGCAPLHHARRLGRDSVEGMSFPLAESVAEGIRVQSPPRGRQILRAVRESAGDVIAVSETEIAGAWRALARQGLFVEPTAAVAPAAAERLRRDLCLADERTTVVALTGSGLKGVGSIAALAQA